MKSSVVEELKYKVFKSGDPLYLFIGLNVAIFILLNLVVLLEFIFQSSSAVSQFLLVQLSMPASLKDFVFKPWTLFTYMVTQKEFFHMLFNMLWLYWMGKIFLSFLNKRQFIFTYLLGGIGGAIAFFLIYNFLPVFSGSVNDSILLGASASVSAIIVGTAVLVPGYTIRLLFFGNVKLVYLAIAFVVLDLLGISGGNPGGNIAHLGGALFGYLYMVQLKKGNDWSSKLITKKKAHVFKKVYKNENPPKKRESTPNQKDIDVILDKILKSGYKSLTHVEKEILFKASNGNKKE